MTFSDNFKNSQNYSKFKAFGCLKLDKYLYGSHVFNNWNKIFKKSNNLRIVYKPRWYISDEKMFFDILEGFIELSKKGNDILVLEHPLLISSLEEKGLLKKYKSFVKKVKSSFKCIDSDNFWIIV